MPTLSLKAFQLAFMDELAGNINPAFRKTIVSEAPDSQTSTEQRINIYCQNHLGARINALASIYTGCKTILGSDTFDQLAREYIAGFASDHWDLNFHGGSFYQFLAQCCLKHETLTDFYYLPDLAKLEWLFHLSYFADAAQVQAAPGQDAQDLCFVTDPSLTLFSSQYPVYTIWYNNINDQGDAEVVDNQDVYYYAICRELNIPQFYPLNQQQYLLLTDCLKGDRLTELAEVHGALVSEQLPLFIGNQWLSPVSC